MYCPNCAAQNKKKQNFCRYCGLHLQDIENTFANQLVFGTETNRLKKLRNIRRATDSAQVFSIVFLLTGVLILVLTDLSIGKVLMTAGLLSYFLSQAIREINGYLQRKEGTRNRKVQDFPEAAIEGSRTNKLIEDRPFTSAASVTERTTAQLVMEAEKTK